MKVLCAIPCLNEEVAIGSVVLRAKPLVADVLVVDDGSSDRTAEVARLAGAKVVAHSKNQGKGKAYEGLWRYAKEHGYDALVVLDGDGQHDAGEIPLLLAKLQEGADFVIGSRWGKNTQMPLWRRFGKRVLDYATAAGAAEGGHRGKLTDSQSGFRAYGPKALAALTPRHAGFSIESQLLMDADRGGLRIAEVPIHCRYDVDGSTQGPVTHAGGVLNELLIQIGVLHPLLLLGLPGMLLLAMGLGIGSWTVWFYETNGEFAIGWALVTVILVIVGILGLFAGLVFNVLPRIVRGQS